MGSKGEAGEVSLEVPALLREGLGLPHGISWNIFGTAGSSPQGGAVCTAVSSGPAAQGAESFSSTGQVDLGLLRCQQLKLYILKAGRALLSHQDQLRQILSQPAVQEATAAHTGTLQRKHVLVCEKSRYCSRKQARDPSRQPMKGNIEMAPKRGSKIAARPAVDRDRGRLVGRVGTPLSRLLLRQWPVDQQHCQYTGAC